MVLGNKQYNAVTVPSPNTWQSRVNLKTEVMCRGRRWHVKTHHCYMALGAKFVALLLQPVNRNMSEKFSKGKYIMNGSACEMRVSSA